VAAEPREVSLLLAPMAYLLDTHVLSETVSPPRPKLVLWVSGFAFDLGSSSFANRTVIA
jgi:hypothetical protein